MTILNFRVHPAFLFEFGIFMERAMMAHVTRVYLYLHIRNTTYKQYFRKNKKSCYDAVTTSVARRARHRLRRTG